MKLLAKKGDARRGVLRTKHGDIQTPFFMPIATKGAVKTLSSFDMRKLGSEILLSNTYHLLLRPGPAEMRAVGGLHNFMNWQAPILTDSGGYQVFSLSKLNDINEDGVAFQSHIDGRRIVLTPEGSVAMQQAIGSDIMMQFDDVVPGDATHARAEEGMERSLRWAKRCFDAHDESSGQQLFGIVQGGTHEDLRRRSVEGLLQIPFDGYAIGGLSVGEPRPVAFRLAKLLASLLPEDKPRYFMGGGMPEEIVYYVSVGVDMFDCVIPTRNARHGTLFTWKTDPAVAVREAFHRAQAGMTDVMIAEPLYEKFIVTQEKYTHDMSPIDTYSEHEELLGFSRAYLRHLFKTDEMLGMRLATLQNLSFYLRMMKELRACIGEK